MRSLASIVLIFFVLFLAAPTIVACLEREKDTTSLCDNCSTSTSSSAEEIKHDIKYYTYNPFLEMSFFDKEEGSGRIIFENLSRHDLISATIFLPPPNKV
ncbi:hypothetical protein [Flavobacterium gilvum]|uniref:Uncharacterized protein n=1 Tax=Flavobacterium gilvum TaxID=1492737 RepID=A0AAC9I2X8_9FLAO|nr:hypothetical protein [Flavobacterium gilvum]AOW09834.1 hypothetical protein EM308_10125 [Flavobacterium gilvum]KFC58074.1 hypothetical protein FEM08_31420 [Flavobacterium gilvum]